MKTVLVTGSSGFIGKNLCSRLDLDEKIKVLHATRESSSEDLRECVAKADFIFHLAGVNRPRSEEEFDEGNRQLTEDILKYIDSSGKKIPLLITSSIQADSDNPYGRSKRAAEEAVFAWAEDTENQVFVYRLPNVFGKWSRPDYNTVVATFCNNIARNKDIQVHDPDAKLNLVYIDSVVESFLQVMNSQECEKEKDYCTVSPVFEITLGQLAHKIQTFREIRDTLVVPNLEDELDRFLYATYTSFLPENKFSYKLDMKTDNRGWLAEFIKSEQFGQIFISKTKPGISRGNHWHHTKIEKFLVIDGDAVIKFRHIISGEELSYGVSGREPEVVDIPAGYAHSITNIGKSELITVFWADEILNTNKPDTYFEEV